MVVILICKDLKLLIWKRFHYGPRWTLYSLSILNHPDVCVMHYLAVCVQTSESHGFSDFCPLVMILVRYIFAVYDIRSH